MAKEFRTSAVISSVIMLAIGLIFLIKPKLSIGIICYTIAAAFFLFAVTRLLVYLKLRKDGGVKATGNLAAMILTVILALVFVIRPDTISRIIPIVLGAVVLANGVVLVISGILYHKFLPKKGLWSFLIGALGIVLGLLAVTHSIGTGVILMQFIGASLTVSALSTLINQIMIERAETAKEDVTDVAFTTEPNTPEQPTEAPEDKQ